MNQITMFGNPLANAIESTNKQPNTWVVSYIAMEIKLLLVKSKCTILKIHDTNFTIVSYLDKIIIVNHCVCIYIYPPRTYDYNN